MSKQVQVNLAFNADTTKAKQQINDLVDSLNKISTKDSQIFDDKQLRDAAKAAQDLTKHLTASVNVDTGKIDLNKFTQSLSNSKTSLTDLYNQLSKAGPEGQKAFSQLSSAIASSDSSVLNLNAKVKDLGVTLKNTIKWQLSSSLVHGFMGALQSAFGYAQDLNSSLNDIRIVTGASVDEMAKFAEQANKAAKSLSSTTTEYTKASLIYYQQGLTDSEVKERTDVTIKMANVSKESAQVVADQMTAVWNNFDDGTKSLEYYADVMTALGAATASSVDEIAGGLEKFASIGDTIGLSYEYAASALATITSNTRQSEEVVGTALKTIFARIQGLSLGETLDDGTSLNKYSEALQTVGISIFDQAGELKRMDDILDEMGDKWGNLSKDQQVALAQTVAGTRQYTQLVALMDNWNNGDSDSFQANLNTSYNAEGALQEQQDIYAKSWEAAADRVQASMEDIYDSLINDEAIVVLLNGLQKILDFTGALIDGFGGLKGILLLVGGIFAKQFAQEVPEAIEKLKSNFDIITGKGQENKVKTLEENYSNMSKKAQNLEITKKTDTADYIRTAADMEQQKAMIKLEKIHSRLTDAQYESAKAKIEEARASKEVIASLQEELEAKEKIFNQTKRKSAKQGSKKIIDEIEEINKDIGTREESEKKYNILRTKKKSELTAEDEDYLNNYDKKRKRRDALEAGLKFDENDPDALMNPFETTGSFINSQLDELSSLQTKWEELHRVNEDYVDQLEAYQKYADSIQETGEANKYQDSSEFKQLTTSMENYLEVLSKIQGIDINVKKEFSAAIPAIKDSEDAMDKLFEKFQEVSKIKINKDGSIENIGNEAKDAEALMAALRNQIDGCKENIKALADNAEDAAARIKAATEYGSAMSSVPYQQAKKENAGEVDNQKSDSQEVDPTKMKFSTALTQVSGMAMDAIALFFELQSAISVCFDSSATAGEKFVAVLSSIPAAAMTIADIMGGLKDLPEAWKTLGDGFKKLKEFDITKTGFASGLANIGGKLTEISSKGGPFAGIIGKIGMAFSGATVSVSGFLTAILPIALAIAAIVAAVYLAVKAFEAWKASTPEGKLEAATKATEEMKNAAQEANQAYEDLLNTINAYENAADALEGLTEGTQEFTNKLLEANKYARELIELYGIASDEYFINDKGLIEFKSGVLEQKQQEYQEKAQKSQQLLEAGERQKTRREQEVKKEQARQQTSTFNGNMWTSEEFDKIYGSIANAGGVDAFNELGKQDPEQQRDILIKSLYGENASWNTLSQEASEKIFSTLNNLDAIKEYEVEYQKNSAQNESSKKNDIIDNISTSTDYQKSSYKEGVIRALTEDTQVSRDIAEDSSSNWSKNKKSTEEVNQAFLEWLGSDNYIYENGRFYKKDPSKEGGKGEEVFSDSSEEDRREILADAEASQALADEGERLAESLAEIEETTMTEDEKRYSQALLNNDLSKLTDEQLQFLRQKDQITLEDLFDKSTLEALKKDPILSEVLEEWLTQFEKSVQEWKPPKLDLEKWKADYTASKDIVSGLKVGDTIDESKYAQLDAAVQQFFTNTGDGIYTLTQNAELLRDVVNDIAAQPLKDEIAEINNFGGMSQKTANQHVLDIEAGNAAGMAFLNSGADKAYIEDVNAKYGTSFTDFATAVDYVNERLGELQSNLAATADQLGELDNLMASGQISSGDYINQLQVLAAQYENCADELDNYQRALEEGNDEAANAADAALHGAIRAGELAKQYGLSAKAIERYAEELKDSGKYANASNKALVEMAKDQLRFDRAVENSQKNMKKWKQDLQNAAKTGYLASESAEQMAEAYGDLLDIDGDLLPSSFLNDAKNLELMEQALQGNEKAYQSLLDKSRQAIAMKIGFDDTDFQNGFNALLMKYYKAQSLDDIQVGASLDDTEFLQGLTKMVNDAKMTAEQATSYLASMGVDAEVIEEPTVSEDTQTYVSATPTINWHSSVGTNPVTGGPAFYTFPEVDYSTSTETIPTSKTTTGVALKVTSANKSSGGAIKHKGSNVAASPPAESGGSGSQPKEPKYAEKKNTSDKTRYHTLQNQLEDLTAEYDALADASDRAFGQAKLNAIDAEIKKTDELIDKQEEYLQAIQSDLPIDKSIMTAYYDEIISGASIEFDDNGNISNYDEIQDAMYDTYNAMTDYDEESLEWQTFEKKYEQLEKYIEQYEETYDLLREEEANYQDLLKQRIDLELEKVEYKVEIQLEVPENQKEVIEYQLGRIEDDAKKTGEALALLTEQAEMTYDQILINKQGLNDALELSLSAAEITEVMAGNMNVLNGKTFTEDQISAIQDYKDKLLELNEEFDDIRESIEETVLEAFDMWHEKLEEGIEKFDYFGTILESYQSIIDTVGKDTLGISDNLINTLSQASVDNVINEVEATRDAYKALQQAQIDAERELEKAKARGDEQSVSFWESTLNEIQQNAEDAHKEMLDSWEEALSKIVEQFEASIQTAVDAFNEAVYQLGGIEALSEEFDRQKEMADMYLDDYQKIYELSKLNRDVNNSIDDTDSLAGKQKLKKLLGEINKLQADGVKMSEYDLEYLQAEYDLRLAEIALEEAQRAKDVVRLSKDNEGNWSYVYTQNTEAVDEAQQKYEDALYAMQDLSSNYINEISAQLIGTSQEMQEALAAIRIEDYASIEEYYEEVERVQEQYQEQLALQEEELNKAVANNKELYDTDWTNYHNAVGYKISDTEEFATKFSDTLLGTLMNSESDTSNFTSILADATSTLMNELYGAAEQYYTNMAAAMEAAGTTTGTFADDLATNVDQIKQDSEEAATAVEDMATHMQEQMDNIINKVSEWQRTYGEAMNEIINANLEVIDSFNEMLATLSMDDSTVTVKYDIQNHNSDVLDAERFATGGYTGSWGNTGRLGILDEKELILNKDDTENFIEALKISRSMLNTIELNARQASLGLGTLIPTTIKDDIKETLEQVVQITAEFPNATDHNEIEEAFNMLINRASQFANRK